MTLIIVSIVLVAGFLVATERLTRINKAAVAMFAAAAGWVLYISYGTDFVMLRHAERFAGFAYSGMSGSELVKEFIAQNVFLGYVGKASEIVLFLLATMTIVEILNNNGCFDFISQLIKTRNSRHVLWGTAVVTFLLSANLDNLTTTVMMLTIVRGVVPGRTQRMLYGSAVVLAANCGGVLTVIGEPAGLVLWNDGAVTATRYSVLMLLPCLIAWLLPTWWIGRQLPERLDIARSALPYRGDDTRLNVWQRALMLFVGIGGLWFIPSFHNITKLSPFLGALCVLSILWVVNEAVNRNLMNTDEMIQRRIPRVLQYGTIQMMLFVMGTMLALGAVKETGALQWIAGLLEDNSGTAWIAGLGVGAVSTVLDNFASAMTMFSFHSVENGTALFSQNGVYWSVVSYAAAVGGNVLCIGSMSGLALIKTERVHVGWFFSRVGWMALLAALLGFLIMMIECRWIFNMYQ